MNPAADSQTVELALCQINPVVGDLAGNADLVIAQAQAARQSGAQVALFPELALSGYPPEDLVLREDFLAAAEAQLARIAMLGGEIVILVGYPEAHAQGVGNALAVIHDGRVITSYRKRLLPNYGVFDERRYFVAGDVNGAIGLGDVTAGLTICEDVWFDDPVYSGLAAVGASVVFNASASPYHAGKPMEREAMLRARTAIHRLPLAYCNLVGGQDELVFDGGSVVIGADGEVLARAPRFEPAMLRCSLSLVAPAPSAGRRADAGAIPAVVLPPPGEAGDNQVTPPVEDRESEVYHALMLGIADYVNKNGFPGVLVGVSGGIDSALVLALACDALGPERVTGVSMPSPYNTPATRADAQTLIERLDCAGHEFSIETIMRSFEAVLSEPFAGRASDATEENVQARIRGTLLMALSNKFGALVLTTGNKSEMAVGYATLYGDMAGGFAALKDVPKQLVFALARWRNAQLPHPTAAVAPIPRGIIDRPPSAELRHGQIDEASLGSYAALDDVIERYIERDQGLDEIVASGVDREYAAKVVRMVDLAEYKRRQAPPGIKITPRAFGRDRRMPITARRRYE
ncbi:MAG: NAD+ synthase [Thermoleophilia bacterium]|nr:NAD+ synthase [Thermoleophilia bacterium]